MSSGADAAEPTTQALHRVMGSDGFLDALTVAICCCDRDGNIRRFNRRATELWGRSPAATEPLERFCAFRKRIGTDGRMLAPDETPMAAVLRSGTPCRDQRLLVERSDGVRLTVLADVEPLHDADGRLVGAVSCFRSATESTETEDAVRSGRVAPAGVFENDGFFENDAVALHVVGTDGTIRRANAAALRLLGYGAAEYVGQPVTAFHADPAVAADVVARLASGERLDKMPARLRARDGSIRHVQISSKGGAGAETGCFLIDVTEEKRSEERMRDSARRFRDVLEALPTAIYTTDAEGLITFCNSAAIDLSGSRPEIGSDRWCIISRQYGPDGTPLPHDRCPMAQALAERRPIIGTDTIAERPDGSRVRFVPYPTPLYDGEGRLTGAVNMLVDITDRHRAEVEAAHLAAIVSSSDDAIISKSLDGIVRSWNDGATRIFGYAADEMIGMPILRIIPPELQAEETEILARLQRGERIDHFETERLTRDGDRIDISLTVSPVHDRSGRIIGASKVARDISERRKAEERQRLLIGELNHRVKNTLATVQSMASQTARFSNDPAEFAARFAGRIRALAKTHDLLTQNAWKGAGVFEVAHAQLLLDGVEDDRVTCAGPTVTLEPQTALHLALVLHELGTNARKHGALSAPGGRLALRWMVDPGGTLNLRWRESGGPAVLPPDARGFGTALIERSLASHRGTARLTYRPAGVACDVTLPLPERRRTGGIGSAALSDPAADRSEPMARAAGGSSSSESSR